VGFGPFPFFNRAPSYHIMRSLLIALAVIASSKVFYGAPVAAASEPVDYASVFVAELKDVSFLVESAPDTFFCTTLLATGEQGQTFYGPILVLPNSLRDVCRLTVNPAPRLSSINGVTTKSLPRDPWKITFTDWKIDGQDVTLVAQPNCIYLIRKDRFDYAMRIVPLKLASGIGVAELKAQILKVIRN
jgi:hypothetical protein